MFSSWSDALTALGVVVVALSVIASSRAVRHAVSVMAIARADDASSDEREYAHPLSINDLRMGIIGQQR